MKIIGIKELTSYKIDKNDWRTWDGFFIQTEGRDIHLLIDSDQDCCETFGQISSNDDLNYFVGAELLEYKAIESGTYDELPVKLKKHLKIEEESDIDVLDCSFIKFETDRGSFDLTVYNHHNGYYGHDIKVIEKLISPLEKVLRKDVE